MKIDRSDIEAALLVIRPSAMREVSIPPTPLTHKMLTIL
jgi:hypothetical protein